MRICLVSSSVLPVPSKTYGAVEGQMLEHARGLSEQGQEVHVLTVGEPSEPEVEILDGVTYHRLGAVFEDERKSVKELMASQARFGLRARRLCQELAPDIVHWHSRYPCLIGTSVPRRDRRWAGIYHAHNWKLAEQMSYPAMSARRVAAVVGATIDRRIGRRCDHVIGVSEFVRRRVIESARLASEKVSVVTNVVDASRFAATSPASRGSGILFVGRIAAEKGLSTLIEAMPEVVRHAPATTLDVVGPMTGGTERGAYGVRCKELVERLGLRSTVRFLGEVPNHRLPELLARAGVLAVPSVWGEPCGVVVLEGMACGVPVVASDVGGIPELVEEGRTGLLCPPGDASAWARALVSALGDAGLGERCAEAGPRVIAERHTWRAVSQRLLSIYERVLGVEPVAPSGVLA